jgi:hypothetical protein
MVSCARRSRSGKTVTPVHGCLHHHIAMNWRRAAWIVLLIAVLWKAWGQWEHRAIHPADGVIAPDEPLQTDANGAPVIVLGRWTLAPRATYDITARILSREDYRFDPISGLAPLDLALGWGPMSDNRVLQALKVSQGARFYSWRPVTESLPIDLREVARYSANTHVIPANAAVADSHRFGSGSVRVHAGPASPGPLTSHPPARASLTDAPACHLAAIGVSRIVQAPVEPSVEIASARRVSQCAPDCVIGTQGCCPDCWH